MDQENYEFLTEKLKYSGFEDKLNARLKKEIKSGKEDFNLRDTMDIGGKTMDVDLFFKKSTISDRYYFNKFEASLRNENPELEPKTHTFYQNQGITAKEAYNLLEGRAVFKSLQSSDKEPYKVWMQLDLSKKDGNNNFPVQQYREEYGFNLEETLRKFPIKELNDQTKTEWMLKSLQKGNTYPVMMERKGMDEIMFIEASPKFKSINAYDASMSSVRSTDLLIGGQKQGKGIEFEPEEPKKKDLKKGEKPVDADDPSSQPVKKTRSRPRI